MYKKLFVIVLALGSALSLKAQTQKGNQLIGGVIGFSFSKQHNKNFYPQISTVVEGDGKSTSFMIGPTYSYFIANNLDLGVSASYDNLNSKFDNTRIGSDLNKMVSNGVTGSIYLRKYFLYKEKAGFRVGPILQYTYNKQENKYNAPGLNYDGKSKLYSGGINADFVYFPVKRLALSAGLGGLYYSHRNTEQQTRKEKASSLNFQLVNSLQLTLSYVLGK